MTIYVLFLIVLCNVTCLRASRVIVSLFAIELGAQQFLIGVLIAMYSVFPMLLALYAGRLSDRLGPRLPMLVGSLGLVAGLLLPFLYPALPALYVSAGLFGMSYVFYHVSVQNLIGAISTDATRTRNFSNYSLMIALGGFIGPSLAGIFIDHFGHPRTYLYLSAVALIPVITLAFAKTIGTGVTKPAGPAEHATSVEEARSLFANAGLRRAMITSGVVLTGTDLFQFYMPIYGHSIGLSASAIGFVLSLVAVAAFVVRVIMPLVVKRVGEEPLLTHSLFLGAATYLFFPIVQNVALLSVLAFVLGLGLGCGQPLSTILTYAHSPKNRSGEALGLRLTVNNATHIVVPLIFGSIGTVLGFAPVFWMNALLLAGGGMLNRAAPRRDAL